MFEIMLYCIVLAVSINDEIFVSAVLYYIISITELILIWGIILFLD